MRLLQASRIQTDVSSMIPKIQIKIISDEDLSFESTRLPKTFSKISPKPMLIQPSFGNFCMILDVIRVSLVVFWFYKTKIISGVTLIVFNLFHSNLYLFSCSTRFVYRYFIQRLNNSKKSFQLKIL